MTSVLHKESESQKIEYLERELGIFSSIVENSADEVYIFDLESLYFTYANQSAIRNIGYSLDEIKEKRSFEISLEYTLESFLEIIEPLKNKTSSEVLLEALYCRKDSSVYDIEISLKTMLIDNKEHILMVAQNVSKNKVLRELLLQKHMLHKQLSRELSEHQNMLCRYKDRISASVIIIMMDTDGIITDISEKFEQVSGFKKNELVGKAHSQSLHPDTDPEFYQEIWKKILYENEWKGKIKKLHKDGSSYWVLAHISADRNLTGEIIGYTIIAQETVSNTEDAVEESEKTATRSAQILAQSRLAQMGEMISMIAHQWRQPLASISAVASTLSIDVMLDNYDEEYFEERLESIIDLSHHLSSTIDDFRGFFKENKVKAPFKPQEMLEECIKLIEPLLLNKHITLETRFDTHNLLISYPNEIKQVVLNILKNSEDAFIDLEDEMKRINIYTYEEEGFSCISISDNAGGIPDAIMDKIFDPYFSTKMKRDGTGLGLYMSKTIIEEHCHGELVCRNKNGGACFILRIPLESEK